MNDVSWICHNKEKKSVPVNDLLHFRLVFCRQMQPTPFVWLWIYVSQLPSFGFFSFLCFNFHCSMGFCLKIPIYSTYMNWKRNVLLCCVTAIRPSLFMLVVIKCSHRPTPVSRRKQRQNFESKKQTKWNKRHKLLRLCSLFSYSNYVYTTTWLKLYLPCA